MNALKRAGGVRPTGARWITDIPAEWECLPAKSLFSSRSEMSRQNDTHLTPSQSHGVLPQQEYMQITGNRVVQNLSGADNMRHVEPGDFISHLRSFQGGLEYSALRGKVSAAYTVLAPRKPLAHGYFRYLFKSTLYIQALQTTTDQLRDGQSIRYQQFALLPLPLPPVQEQQQIAAYLDRETGQIDELITKQEQLVATLTERRQAVITQAITRGLDPTTELKESGIHWWDDIPNHWLLPQVKHHFCVTLGKMLDAKRPAQRNDTLLPYVRAGNIHEESLSLDELNEMPFSPTEVNALNLIRGDLLVVEGGAVGVNQYIHEDLPGISFQKTVNRVRAVGPVSTRFLGYVLDVLRYRGIIDMLCNKSTIAHFTAEKLEQISFPCPPELEQQAIVLFLNSECMAIEALSAKAVDVIALLRERRQALISAAVTGKIDVRGL